MFSEGIKLSDAELERQNHGTIEEIIRRIFGEDLLDAKVAELGERKEAMYRELYRPHLQCIAGYQTFLHEAQTLKIPMAIATSAGECNIDFTLNGLGIRSYFNAIVGGDDVQVGKPHPETFLKAAQQLGVSPEQCLVFEDTHTGIEAAQRAGMKAIAITTTLPAQAFAGIPIVQQIIQDYTTIHPASLLKAIVI